MTHLNTQFDLIRQSATVAMADRILALKASGQKIVGLQVGDPDFATPPAVIDKWNADVTKILSAPEMRERLAAQGAEAAPDSPAEFAQFIARELAKYGPIVKASGAKVD